MNKTLTINISGIIFHIEEDAYDKLSRYLSTIKSYFSHTEGGNEIMSDIEARIAELLQEKLNPGKQVILLMDVDYALDTMGKPEDFGAENVNNASNASQEEEYSAEPIKKRLYRDPDNKVLGGVCSGVGHYFGFDPVWLRIALALLLVFAGTGVLIYIILWIAIPEATTTAEKLAMKGEKVDINNISKVVKEEAEQLKKRMEKYGNDIKSGSNSDVYRTGAEKIVDFFVTVFMGIGKAIIKILGFFLILFGVLFFLGLITSAFGISFVSNFSIGDWADMFLMDGKDFYLGLIGLFLFIAVPVLGMIYGGMKLLFKFKYSNRWMNLSASIIWLIGLVLILYVGLRTAKDFNKTAKVREKVTLDSSKVLNLTMREIPLNYEELNTSDMDHEGERNYRTHRGESNYAIGSHGAMKYLIGHAQLNIIKSQNNQLELVIVKEAKAEDKLTANERAKNIVYKATQNDSTVVFDNLFKVNNADKFRFQNVTAILKLPVGQIIYLDKTVENLIYDIENVTNTYDGDMIERRWIMTEAGLECVDCEGLDEETDDWRDHKEININAHGVHIKSRSSKVKVDSDGVRVSSDDAKVIIDKNGIKVKAE
ncbi:MAG: PspC domain-containing protein [Bacteroidia bacterium]|nr:PspC domain-containing protein [Bacteroidia bacterium]